MMMQHQVHAQTEQMGTSDAALLGSNGQISIGGVHVQGV